MVDIRARAGGRDRGRARRGRDAEALHPLGRLGNICEVVTATFFLAFRCLSLGSMG